ncbi:MAG: tetratricopeptide repeat protein [Labilithrix sp.]|nr:tetratricopeptide repeat protein [Labilithrix sp.]MBX3220952.1 tetratricopeptide repeat protein [Labilithrix sp.]
MTHRRRTHRLARVLATLGLVVVGAACGGTSQEVAKTPQAPQRIDASNQIIGTRAEGTARELLARGERALLAQSWQEAVDAFEALLAGDPQAANDPQVIYDLALAYEGLGDREKARVRYREVVSRFPTDPNARSALAREVSLDAYLEDWKALGEVGEQILARKDIEVADKMLGLGARGLARITAGDEAGASRDVNEGLDLVEETRFGATGQLPVAAAMLKYAQGEIRKVRSEKIVLVPPPPDFLHKLEMRCQLLLDAQSSYADAIRSVDLHWAAMSGYRVGEMYRTLHQHLMMIPPTDKAKTESDKQLFYGIMHVRYRALLEKGIEMMKRTLALGERTGVASGWMKRAESAKAEMDRALEEEKATIKRFPFTEETLEKTLEIMKKKAADDAAKASGGAGAAKK